MDAPPFSDLFTWNAFGDCSALPTALGSSTRLWKRPVLCAERLDIVQGHREWKYRDSFGFAAAIFAILAV